jgi:phosphatidylinositol glycan class C protein
MLLVHLLFHNYGVEGAMVSYAISLNAAIFASVCLASRLPTVWHVFVTVLFAVFVFALGPLTRNKLKVLVQFLIHFSKLVVEPLIF